jgi:hypothetical protein
MSGEGTGYVWRYSPYHGATLLVHLALGDIANDANRNELWLSIASIAKKARVSRSTASAALKELCDSGFLTMLESGQNERKPSRYWMRTSPESGLVAQIAVPESGLDTPGERSSTSPESGRVTKEERKNRKPPDKDCIRCRGRGSFYRSTGDARTTGTGGTDVDCSCTFVTDPALALVDSEVG